MKAMAKMKDMQSQADSSVFFKRNKENKMSNELLMVGKPYVVDLALDFDDGRVFGCKIEIDQEKKTARMTHLILLQSLKMNSTWAIRRQIYPWQLVQY
jgi:hypothetical protein